jgi:hypothetical protein
MWIAYHLYNMSLKIERSTKKKATYEKPIDKLNKYSLSLGIGCILGLFIFLLANPFYTSSFPSVEAKNVVGDCKASVISFVPLGAYPGGSQQVISALNYCETLGQPS